MKIKTVIPFLCFILVFFNARAQDQEIETPVVPAIAGEDTLKADTGGEITEEKEDGVLYITSFRQFMDSLEMYDMAEPVCHEWVNDDIHVRKYDFSLTTDTFAIVFGEEFGNYCHPRKDKVSSGFGTRRWRFHYGVDIGLDTGDPVYCAFDGVVRISTYSKTYGNVVVVRHANGLETLYAHLSKRSVDIDSTLLSGDVIGLGGNTGRSYGSHLHFETRFFDEAIDPRDIIDFENYDLLNDSLELTACHFHYRDYIKELNKIQYHIVKKGNTLSHIAKWYGTSVSQICRLNGISKSKVLQIGERIRVR